LENYDLKTTQTFHLPITFSLHLYFFDAGYFGKHDVVPANDSRKAVNSLITPKVSTCQSLQTWGATLRAFSVTCVRENTLDHSPCETIYVPIPMSGHFLARCVGRLSPDSTIAELMNSFTTAKGRGDVEVH
jgi:hypothetical protein